MKKEKEKEKKDDRVAYSNGPLVIEGANELARVCVAKLEALRSPSHKQIRLHQRCKSNRGKNGGRVSLILARRGRRLSWIARASPTNHIRH